MSRYGRHPRFVAPLAALVGALALSALPSTALAAGEPGASAVVGSAVFGVAADAGGKVVTVGSSGGSMLVQRVSATGAADPAFAAGSGVAKAVAVQADGKILVAGSDGGAVVRRFNADGSLDTSFGSGGTAHPPGSVMNAVAVGPCGTVVAGGSAPGSDAFPRAEVVRLQGTGAPDPGFGSNGVASLDLGRNSQVNGVALQSDGKVVLAAQQAPGLQVTGAAVARVTATGATDTSFGPAGSGVYSYDAQGGANSAFNAIAVDASGRIVAAGADIRSDSSLATFVRLSSAGAADGAFGSGGVIRTTATANFGGSLPIGARGLALTASGEIVGVGAFQDSGLRSAALWAIAPNGQLDPAVGTGGLVVTRSTTSNNTESFAAAIATDGSIVAGGVNTSFVSPDAGVVRRYNGFGAALAPVSFTAGCPAPQQMPPLVVKPKLSSARLSPSSLGRTTKAKLSFTLSKAASVKLTVAQPVAGRKAKSSAACRVTKKKTGKACVLYVSKGSKTLHGKVGANKATITRAFGSRVLKPGKYRLTLAVSGGNTVQLSLTVRKK